MAEQIKNRYVVITLLLISAIYLYPNIFKIWYMWDIGTYAQSGERVLNGEFPHRDFDELFTGGLTFLNAAAFDIFGIKFSSIRYPLFIFSLLFVWSLYSISTRFISPIKSAGVALLAFMWSIPTFPHASPTWYTIFFAAFGIVSLMKYVESQHRVWLIFAGLCGGISVLFKITGLYYIAAVLIFLIYYEQNLSEKINSDFSYKFFLLSTTGLTGIILSVAALINNNFDTTHVVHHLLPVVIICFFVAWNEWHNGRGNCITRIKQLCKLLVPFVAGIAAPILIFAFIFYLNDALIYLYHGVFVSPLTRINIQHANALPSLMPLVYCIPLFILLIIEVKPKTDFIISLILIPVFCIILINAGNNVVNHNVWDGLRYLPLISVFSGCIYLFKQKKLVTNEKRRFILLLMICMVGFIPLVQYPFPHTIYFLYGLPFVTLLLIFVMNSRINPAKLAYTVCISFVIIFYIFWVRDIKIDVLGLRYEKAPKWGILNLERGDMYTRAPIANTYNTLVPFIQNRASSKYLYATPDVPDLYFLTGLNNPTRTLWDLFDSGYSDVSSNGEQVIFNNFAYQNVDVRVEINDNSAMRRRNQNIMEMLDKYNISSVVINNRPEDSKPIDFELAQKLSVKYKQWQLFGKYIVGWNDINEKKN